MPQTQRTDSNGTYWVISPTEWQGSVGQALRAQGWTYCGFGTYGIIIAPAGAPCFVTSGGGAGGPNIGPTAPPTAPPTTTPGPASGVPDKACGSCSSSSGQPLSPTSPVTGPTTVAPTQPKPTGFPWWVWVLVTLTLAQVVYGRNT